MIPETIIYTKNPRIACSGEDNDHPKVWYEVPAEGFAVCGYCGLKFAKEHKDVLEHMVSFKFHKKNPLVPTKLIAGYEAFKRARYHKKIIKIINENLL